MDKVTAAFTAFWTWASTVVPLWVWTHAGAAFVGFAIGRKWLF